MHMDLAFSGELRSENSYLHVTKPPEAKYVDVILEQSEVRNLQESESTEILI